MRSIRKFVGCIRVAAGLGAALALGLSVQTVAAHVAAAPSTGEPSIHVASLSPECRAALMALRDAIVVDRQEDADELHNPNPAGDAAEDAAEASQFKALISNLRSACAAQIAAIQAAPPVATKPSVSSQCSDAVAALRAYARSIWAQHSAPTAAQSAQLRELGTAVKAACNWPARA